MDLRGDGLMRARHTAVAAAILAILGPSACSVDSPARPPGAAPTVHVSLQDRLRDGLLTQGQIPPGFHLSTEAVNLTTTGAPRGPASAVPIASMPCSELPVANFMTTHARPVEDVAVGLVRTPVGDDDNGWFGQESLDRYAPGQAAAVMSAIRGTVQRCPSYSDTLDDGTRTQDTVSMTGADVQADDSLVLRIASSLPGGTDPFVTDTAFVREGDVILGVYKVVEQKPPAGVGVVLSRAVAAYCAAATG